MALLTLAVVVIAPRGERAAGDGARGRCRCCSPAATGTCGTSSTVGNPIPFTEWGPLGLPSPERAFELRPGFSVAHYWNDTEVWCGLVLPEAARRSSGRSGRSCCSASVAGGAYALWRGREPILRALGAVALLTAIAYVFTPLTAGGEEGEPIAFEWNIRYLAPAVAIGLAILPCLPALRATERRRHAHPGRRSARSR